MAEERKWNGADAAAFVAAVKEGDAGTLLGIAANIRDSAACLLEAPAVTEDDELAGEARYIEAEAKRMVRILCGKPDVAPSPEETDEPFAFG